MHIKFIIFFLIASLLVAQPLPALTFSKTVNASFVDVGQSSIAFTDVEGDGDQDVLITGEDANSNPIAELYTNDGNGNFTEKSATPFVGVKNSSIAFADVDGDNDQDLLVTGDTSKSYTSDPISKLYINDGQGNFSEVSTPFKNVESGSIAFADIEGDGDKDVLITGVDTTSNPIAELYTNDGQGNFSVVMGTPFKGVRLSSIGFADVEGNGNLDVLITGWDNDNYIANLYTNDGNGNFTEKSGTPFEGVVQSSIAFADVDNDSTQDVLITGRDNNSNPITELYTNDGQGNFEEVAITPFDDVYYSSIAFADVDRDNDQDILLTGKINVNDPVSTLYSNAGQGNFIGAVGNLFDGVHRGSIGFADVDGDNDKDVLITGLNSNNNPVSKLYINNGQGNFSEVIGTSFDNPAANASFKGIDVLPYPNPIKGKHLHVRYNAPENGDVQVKVYGMKGDLVKQQKEFTGTRQQSLSIDLPSLAHGSYILELQQGKRKGYAKFTVH